MSLSLSFFFNRETKGVKGKEKCFLICSINPFLVPVFGVPSPFWISLSLRRSIVPKNNTGAPQDTGLRSFIHSFPTELPESWKPSSILRRVFSAPPPSPERENFLHGNGSKKTFSLRVYAPFFIRTNSRRSSLILVDVVNPS